MGDDDANVGGPGECPGHEFVLVDMLLVKSRSGPVPGMGVVETCRWCGMPAYVPSTHEAPN